MKDTAERAVGGEGLQDRAGIGQSAGFDYDAAEVRHLAALTVHHEPPQGLLQIGASDAAHASISKQDRFVRARSDQHVVDAGRAEFVDDDHSPLSFRRIQKTLEKRGLSGAKKPSDHGNRQARPAFALEPASEASGGG
jgi:hypothetical protein